MRRLALVVLVCLLGLAVATPPVEAGRGGSRKSKASRSAKSKKRADEGSKTSAAGGAAMLEFESELVTQVPEVAAAIEQVNARPDEAAAWTALGRALADFGAHGYASDAFERAVDLGPDSADNWVNLGTAEVRAGEFGRGKRAFEQALDVEPFHALAHYNLGVVELVRGRYDSAIESFETALLLDPTLGDPTLNVGAVNNPYLPYVKLRVYMRTTGSAPALFTYSNPGTDSSAP
ncbi:MAG: tetratricopeptide repeat protein [Acidobacteriota bacterium]|nr:MAG: tetratricopeptide repeat protein [Acidobacteriota bacterium]